MNKNVPMIGFIISLMTVFCTGFLPVNAQSPQAFKYQAVARNLNGDPVIDQDIAVRISILSGSETGPVVYSELHEIPTNQMGLFTLEIGNATYVLFGNFSEIGWGVFPHFLKTEIDITGGADYQLMGVSQLLSVPYALYANEAGNAENYVAGTGINVSNSVITNTAPDQNVTIASGNGISTTGTYPNFMVTNTNPDQNVTLSSGYGITTSGAYPNFTITNAKPNATHTGDASGSNELTVTGIQGRNVSNLAPTLDQVYQWDGTRWMPSTLDPYTAGTGIEITNNVVSNTAPNVTHTGDATGGSTLTVVKIQGRSVSSTTPTSNQVLQWNGSAWAPTTLATPSEDWKLTGNSGVSETDFVGTTNMAALHFRVSNQVSGVIDYDYLDANTTFGYRTLNNLTSGFSNAAFGYKALESTTSGWNNVALGCYALGSNTTGNHNSSLGESSLTSNSTGNTNVAIGAASLRQNETGNSNVAIGYLALYKNQSANSSVAIGTGALYNNTTRSNLVAIGDSALFKNGLGATLSYQSVMNTALGSKALFLNTTGYSNTAVGFNALYSNSSGSRNTACGREALYSITDGTDNIGIGCFSLQNNSSGDYNIAIGNNTLKNSTTGNDNIVVGHYALLSNLDGNDNSALGYNALYNNTSGDQNIAVGKNSLFNNDSGNNNTAVGFSALENNSTGINNTAIGAESSFISASLNNTTCLGYQAGNISNASNRVAIGNTSVSWIGGQVNWSIYSDERIKENVKEDVAGLEFINRLRPVTYNLNIHTQNEMFKIEGKESSDWPGKFDIENIRMTGFIAQEVEKAAQDAGYDFSGVEAPENDGLYSLRYSDFVVPLVKAVQEQQVIIDEMQKKNENLQKQIDELKATLKK